MFKFYLWVDMSLFTRIFLLIFLKLYYNLLCMRFIGFMPPHIHIGPPQHHHGPPPPPHHGPPHHHHGPPHGRPYWRHFYFKYGTQKDVIVIVISKRQFKIYLCNYTYVSTYIYNGIVQKVYLHFTNLLVCTIQ